jgi:hypothetical protein
MATPKTSPVPKPLELFGIGPVPLTWDKAAMFRADECALYTTKGLGFARAVKYAWCMAPDAVRAAFPTPESLASVVPPVTAIWASVNPAIAASGEGMSPKNVFGSTSGRSPSSS